MQSWNPWAFTAKSAPKKSWITKASTPPNSLFVPYYILTRQTSTQVSSNCYWMCHALPTRPKAVTSDYKSSWGGAGFEFCISMI